MKEGMRVCTAFFYIIHMGLIKIDDGKFGRELRSGCEMRRISGYDDPGCPMKTVLMIEICLPLVRLNVDKALNTDAVSVQCNPDPCPQGMAQYPLMQSVK